MKHPQSKRPAILLVDDAPTNLRLLADMLAADYTIAIANSGLAAIKIATNQQPDLILLDVMMPEMDGYEVCRQLKNSDATRKIPVIFVTSLDGSDAETKGFDLGAVDYIVKPFYPSVVRARVRSHIQLKQRNDLLEQVAFLDGLTGIPNRRKFDQHLHHEWRRALRSRSPLSLLMIDVDYFKQFNDLYGHGAGDDCLRRIARVIDSITSRPGDLGARYGGEEFVVILQDSNLSGAVQLAERLRQVIMNLKIAHADSSTATVVTTSIGVATLIPTADQSEQQLLDLADQAMYSAKEQGRNRVVNATANVEPTNI